MTRHDRIRSQLNYLEGLGIISEWYTQSQMPGKRWLFTPCGMSERSLSTTEVEEFINGAQAALNREYDLTHRSVSDAEWQKVAQAAQAT